MNIYFLSHEPQLCAIWLDDKRLNKLATETAQMLCYALANNGVERDRLPYATGGSHKAHPVTKWVGATRANFLWTVSLGLFLCDEHRFRQRNAHDHGAKKVVITCGKMFDKVPEGLLLMPPNCAAQRTEGVTFDRFDHPVEAYRHYSNWRWFHDKRAPTWKNRVPPPWYTPSADQLVLPDDGRKPNVR